MTGLKTKPNNADVLEFINSIENKNKREDVDLQALKSLIRDSISFLRQGVN